MHQGKSTVRAVQYLPPSARLTHVMCIPPACEFPAAAGDALDEPGEGGIASPEVMRGSELSTMRRAIAAQSAPKGGRAAGAVSTKRRMLRSSSLMRAKSVIARVAARIQASTSHRAPVT
jgi:hypothetical protein